MRPGRLLLRLPAALTGARSARRGARATVVAVLAAALLGAAPTVSPAAGVAPVAGEAAVAGARSAGLDAAPVGSVSGAPAISASPAAPAALPQPPGKTSVVSLNVNQQFANGSSLSPAISSSGRYVAFASVATDLVPRSTRASSSVYLRDRSSGTTIRLPVPSVAGVPTGAGYAYEPSISADGSVVAFTYRETADPASPQSVVVWDRTSGRTTIVSEPNDANDASHQPAVSGNGRYIAYSSTAPRLIPGYQSQYADVYRFDRQTGQTVLVSTAAPNQKVVSGDSDMPSISGDGSEVAFDSTGGQSLTPQASGEGIQVYVRDMNAGTTQQVSIGPGGQLPQGPSGQPSISDDGTLVAFTSAAANFLPGGEGTGIYEVYRRDLTAGQTVLVSVMDDGTPMTAASVQPNISRDGRMVAYVVNGALLTTAVLSRQSSSIVLRDVTAGQNAYITVTPTGAQSNSLSRSPKVAGAGRYVAFASTAIDLVANDPNNNAVDVFLRDMPPVPKLAPPTLDFGTRAVGVTSVASTAGVLRNAGWGPLAVKAATVGGTNAADFPVLADGCKGLSLYRGDACTVSVGFTPAAQGTRTAQLQIPDSYTGSPRTARLIGRGSQAKIVLDPPIGQQGIVVVATGSGFPAGAQLQLTWSLGITPNLPVVTADSKGRFRIQVLVFHHDAVGERNLVATWVGGPEFPTLEVPMLVTVRSAVPPGYGVSTGNGPLTTLFRG